MDVDAAYLDSVDLDIPTGLPGSDVATPADGMAISAGQDEFGLPLAQTNNA